MGVEGLSFEEYRLEVGMYFPSTGERLSLLNEAGQVKDTRMLLGKVQVTGSN